MNPRASLAVVAAVAVASAGIGWVAGRQIRSPADLAAEAQPPEASLITVPVERVALSSDVVIRGQVEFSESTDILASGSADGAAIVTRLPKGEGESLVEGDVVVELAGRPMLALQGSLPVFRSLTPGLDGPDVRQLEEALVRLGYDPGSVDGLYDAATEAAVSVLYRDRGFAPNEPTAEELERVEQARRSVRSAREALKSAEQAAAGGIARSERLELDRQVAAAQAALEQARLARDAAVGEAQAAAAAAATALDGARAAATITAQRLTQAETGVHPDTGAAPTPEELDELREANASAVVTLEEADRGARTTAAAVVATTKENDALVADAAASVEIAIARRAETLATAGRTDGAATLADARAALTEAQSALDRLEGETGVTLPSAELVFLPQLPNEIQSVNAEVGKTPQTSVMTVTGSGVRITSTVSAADRSLLEVGAQGLMADEGLGLSIPVGIVQLADSPGGTDTSSERYRVWLEPIGDLPPEALNQNLRVTIPFDSSDGEVLAVPLAALSAGADGSARVEVERADGSVDLVTVVPGLNARAQGLVEITPVDGDLAEGDRVVVGRNQTPEPDAESDADEPDPDESESGAVGE